MSPTKHQPKGAPKHPTKSALRRRPSRVLTREARAITGADWSHSTPTEPLALDAQTLSALEDALRVNLVAWRAALERDAAGVPRLPVEFVAERGRAVRMIDIRDAHELTGPLGHIPAVTHHPLSRVAEIPQVLAPDTCVVLISNRDSRASVAARFLETLGMRNVAVLDGGMRAWRQRGFSTLRDEHTYRPTLCPLPHGLGRDGRPLVVTPHEDLTLEDVEAHVGDPTTIRWVKLAGFLLNGKRSCVDGRDDNAVIGTPGGDAGELLVALTALENINGRDLTDEEVRRTLTRFNDIFGRCYMHSDTHATDHLIAAIRAHERLGPLAAEVEGASAWREWLLKPPPAARDDLLDLLTDPKSMGCGHLRFVMTSPEYEVRPALTRAFLRAFHSLRWSGAPELEWVILGGDHSERAVLSVRVAEPIRSWTRVPLISPQVAGQQVFISHPQVSSYARAELASFLAAEGLTRPSRERKLLAEMERLAAAQGALTLSRLAAGLPIFEVQFDHFGLPVTRALGQVE